MNFYTSSTAAVDAALDSVPDPENTQDQSRPSMLEMIKWRGAADLMHVSSMLTCTKVLSGIPVLLSDNAYLPRMYC